MHTRNVAPWHDFETMPGRAATYLHRHAYYNADRAHDRWPRTPEHTAETKFWDDTWVVVELAIEERLDS